jgi:hypothetical protein
VLLLVWREGVESAVHGTRLRSVGDISRLELTSLHLRGCLIRCNKEWKAHSGNQSSGSISPDSAREQAVKEGVLVFHLRYVFAIGPVKV